MRTLFARLLVSLALAAASIMMIRGIVGRPDHDPRAAATREIVIEQLQRMAQEACAARPCTYRQAGR